MSDPKSLEGNDQPRQDGAARRDRDLSGQMLGSFRLLRRLGRGAMAEVYLAEQERLQRQVAIKVLKPELAGDRTYLQRFELEARAAASLVHANIVQIYEVGCVAGLHYIAQEYVQGQDLRNYIARRGPADLAPALSIMRQVAAALAKAAEQGVVHRDIKPENIMLTAGGEVKVADFGLARLTTEASNELTQVGLTLGTPLYMSPEQVEGKSLDARSDIYSFGVTCYQMLAGVPPFEGETALGVAVQHLKTRPKPLESRRPDLPPALCRIVHQMLAKEPAERFATGRELLRELRRLQLEYFGDDWPENLPPWEPLAAETAAGSQTAAAQKLQNLMKQSTAATRQQRRRHLAVVAAVVIAFTTGGALAWRWAVPRSLLADARGQAPVIVKESSALRQYYRACQLGSEAGWKSVLNYFPEKKYVGLRAKQQLALLYLRKDDWQQAMTVFAECTQLNLDDKNLETELRAFGLAGQCGVLSLSGKYAESNAVLAQLAPIRDKLTSEPMRRLVANAVTRNCEKLGQQATREWGQWLKEQFHEDG